MKPSFQHPLLAFAIKKFGIPQWDSSGVARWNVHRADEDKVRVTTLCLSPTAIWFDGEEMWIDFSAGELYEDVATSLIISLNVDSCRVFNEERKRERQREIDLEEEQWLRNHLAEESRVTTLVLLDGGRR